MVSWGRAQSSGSRPRVRQPQSGRDSTALKRSNADSIRSGHSYPVAQRAGDHTVETAFERGWNGLDNGQLLEAAESEGFELLVTTDQNLRFQQNVAARRISILVLTTTSWPRIRQHTDLVVAAIAALRAGEYRELSFPA